MEFYKNTAVVVSAKKVILLTVFFCGLSIGYAVASDKPAVHQNIGAILESDPRAALFTHAVKSSSLWQELVNTDKATVFVPSNSALRTEGSAFLLEIVLLKPENAERLDSLVAQHLVPNETIEISSLTQPTDFIDQLGGCLSVAPLATAIKVGPEAFVTDSIVTSNGTVYFIDRLLWQPYQEQAECPGV